VGGLWLPLTRLLAGGVGTLVWNIAGVALLFAPEEVVPLLWGAVDVMPFRGAAATNSTAMTPSVELLVLLAAETMSSSSISRGAW
jgi:hypothetical protein